MWNTKARYVAAACGRGSGKTELSRRRIVRFLAVPRPSPEPMYFFALPTYRQAKRVAWTKIVSLIPTDWLAREPNSSNMEIRTTFGSWLFVVGLDKPQRIEGDQWDGCIIDESSDVRPGAFGLSVLPALSHRGGWCWRIGVPKRVGIGAIEYKAFWDAADAGALPDAEAYTWGSRGIVSDAELEKARQMLDSRDYQEQYEASWENAAGAIYHAFEESRNVCPLVAYDPSRPLVIGSDFNVDPMCWVICQEWEDRRGIDVIDEIMLRNATTRSTLDELWKRYGTHGAGFEFIGDATSRARNTRAAFSDYAQITADPRFKRARINYPKANPLFVNRVAATNAMLHSAAGEVRIRIHPRCKRLLLDYRDRQYLPGSRECNDKGDLGHMSDAFDYVIYRKHPIRITIGDPDRTPTVRF